MFLETEVNHTHIFPFPVCVPVCVYIMHTVTIITRDYACWHTPYLFPKRNETSAASVLASSRTRPEVDESLPPAAGEGSNPSETPTLSSPLRVKYQPHTDIPPRAFLQMCPCKPSQDASWPLCILEMFQVYSAEQNYHIKRLQTADHLNSTAAI